MSAPAAGAAARRRAMLAAWGVALALGAAAAGLADRAARTLPPPRPLEELSYYPSGVSLKPAALGHAESFADLAWLRAVQYYGEHRTTDLRFDRMEHVFDILTTLAPRFEPAYVFGAFALAQEGRNFPAGERLMQKGLRANPRSGWLAFEAGFLYYVKPGGRDLLRAAQHFEDAARLPGGPPQAARFAAFARQHGGDLAVAYALWAEVRDHSPNAYLRDIAEREMERIRTALEERRHERAMRRLSTPAVVLRDGD
uniref:Sel1 repeat family protein n=1 Tax=Eiseniibacteriota bacterium TaxID=2212470 RepID=A0A832MMK0_UNCEI